MQGESSQERDELRARVRWAYIRAKVCIKCARAARGRGDWGESTRWIAAARALRQVAADLRDLSPRVLGILICFIGSLNGCAKSHSLTRDHVEFGFDSHEDGSITWVIEFEPDAWKATLSQGEDRGAVTVLRFVGVNMEHNGIEAQRCHITSHKTFQDGGERIVGQCRSTGARGTGHT